MAIEEAGPPRATAFAVWDGYQEGRFAASPEVLSTFQNELRELGSLPVGFGFWGGKKFRGLACWLDSPRGIGWLTRWPMSYRKFWKEILVLAGCPISCRTSCSWLPFLLGEFFERTQTRLRSAAVRTKLRCRPAASWALEGPLEPFGSKGLCITPGIAPTGK